MAFFLLLPSWGGAASIIVNGDFSDSLTGWTTTGPVFDTGESAVFTDDLLLPANLFQTSLVPEGLLALELSFDFLNGLSPAAPLGFLPDSFFATLYLGESAFGSSILGSSSDVTVGLFDMDAGGTFNVASDAFFGSSPKGAGWSRFSLTYGTAPDFTGPGFATIAFEFFDLNGIAVESRVVVDNVRMVVVVPEPGAALMVMIAATLLPLRRRRTSSDS